MWKNTRNVFYKMRATRNTYSKGNIDHSNSALAATDKIYVYILRSKCGKTPEMFSIKRVRFVTNSKGINIDHSKSALAATDKMCIFFVLNAEKHQKCFL